MLLDVLNKSRSFLDVLSEEKMIRRMSVPFQFLLNVLRLKWLTQSRARDNRSSRACPVYCCVCLLIMVDVRIDASYFNFSTMLIDLS